MPRIITKAVSVALICGAGTALAGCTVSQLHLSDDFGTAKRQDVVAQVADPSPRYVGTPAPGSAGSRVDLAQQRYQNNAVIAPATTSTSTVTNSNGSGGGGGH